MDYSIYIVDTETTGLDDHLNDVIELSLFRLSDGVQKTWCIKPINVDNIEADALRINKHKLEDILHKTAFGRETYQDPNKVIIEVENWLMEDGVPGSQRVLGGQNVSFDRNFLTQLWKKCGVAESFPFGRRFIDTMVIEFFFDLCKETMSEGYSLNNLTKKYGITNSKAHSAAADTLATKLVLDAQIKSFKKMIKTGA